MRECDVRTRSEGGKVCANECDAGQTGVASAHDSLGLLAGELSEDTLDGGRGGIVFEAFDDGEGSKVSKGLFELVERFERGCSSVQRFGVFRIEGEGGGAVFDYTLVLWGLEVCVT